MKMDMRTFEVHSNLLHKQLFHQIHPDGFIYRVVLFITILDTLHCDVLCITDLDAEDMNHVPTNCCMNQVKHHDIGVPTARNRNAIQTIFLSGKSVLLSILCDFLRPTRGVDRFKSGLYNNQNN